MAESRGQHCSILALKITKYFPLHFEFTKQNYRRVFAFLSKRLMSFFACILYLLEESLLSNECTSNTYFLPISCQEAFHIQE